MNTNTHSGKPLSFLFATWEGGGNVAPALTVARKLLDRGHQVRFMCDESSRSDTEKLGIAFRPWIQAPNRLDRSLHSCPVRDWESTSPQEGIQRVMDNIMIGPARLYAQDLIEELENEPVDLVVTSEMLLGVMAACESQRTPFAIFAANLCFYPFPSMPAFGPGFPPPRNEEEKAMHSAIKEGTVQMFDTGLTSYNLFRNNLNLPPLNHVIDQANSAGLFMLGTSQCFDFEIDDLPPNLHYVGPQLDSVTDQNSWTNPWSRTDERPLVLIGFSTTFQNHADCLQRVIDACSAFEIRTLATLGQIDPTSLRSVSNCRIVTNTPHDQVMKEATLVITHGGHGTVMRALSYGRPMLIIPHGRDQNENAIRVTERGAGISLSQDSSVVEIKKAIDSLLSDPSFTHNARNLGARIRRESETSNLTSLLESLASPQRTCCQVD